MVTWASGWSSFTAWASKCAVEWRRSLQALAVLVGDDGDLGVGVDAMGGIHQLAVHPAGERSAREPRADRLRDLGHGHRPVEFLDRSIGQSDIRHSYRSKKQRVERRYDVRSNAPS